MKRTIAILLLMCLMAGCNEVQMSPRMEQAIKMSAINVRAMSNDFNATGDVEVGKSALMEAATTLEEIVRAMQ